MSANKALAPAAACSGVTAPAPLRGQAAARLEQSRSSHGAATCPERGKPFSPRRIALHRLTVHHIGVPL